MQTRHFYLKELRLSGEIFRMTNSQIIKSRILNWFDNNDQPMDKRGKLSTGIDRMLIAMEKRDDWSETMTVLLGEGTKFTFNASARYWRATACSDGIAVSTFVPGWGFGWRDVFKDEYVYQTLSWLAHYARQYIHRSYVSKVLMIAWERDNVILHPFGNKTQGRRYGAVTEPVTARAGLNTAVSDLSQSWGNQNLDKQSRSKWVYRNTLDPAIHQAIFYFLRGQSLIKSGFYLEATVAFDCVLQSLQVIEWGNSVGDPRRIRSDLVKTLKLGEEDAALSSYTYFLRNEFGAHAGGWRWWDSGEYVSRDTIGHISLMAHRVLKGAADAEPDARRVSLELQPWSAWFMQNSPVLFDATWFRSAV